MLTKQEILDLISKYDYKVGAEENEEYIFNKVGKNIRKRGYAIKEEFLKIVRWKSARAIRKAENNSNEIIERITKSAFETDNEEEKIKILITLNGVSIPMASSVLTIVYPDKYAVIDIRGWHTLFNLGLIKYKKDTFNIKDWLLYLKVTRDLSKKWEITPREVDKVIFMYDKIHREGRLYKK